MKKLFLILIIGSLISGLCFSQEPQFDLRGEIIDTHKRLDSIVEFHYLSNTDSIPYRKLEFAYDNYGHKILEESYTWNINVEDWTCNGWVQWAQSYSRSACKVEWRYNLAGEISTAVAYKFDTRNGDLVKSFKVQFEYDEAGNVIVDAFYKWDRDNNIWKGDFRLCWDGCIPGKYENKYDSSGKKTMEARYNWDDEIMDWVCYEKWEGSYYSNNKIRENIYYNMNWDNNLELSYKVCYLYNPNDRIISSEKYDWDSNLLRWQKDSKEQYVYDIYGNITSRTEYGFNMDLAQYLPRLIDKTEYCYDSTGNCLVSLNKNWDHYDSMWNINEKMETDFDSLGNKLMEAKYRWDSGNEEWYGITKFNRQFDKDGNVIDSINSRWNQDDKNWKTSDHSERTFDSLGRKTAEIGYIWISSKNKWITCGMVEFRYDQFGNKILELGYRWNDNGHLEDETRQDYLYDIDKDLLIYSSSRFRRLGRRIFYYYESTTTSKNEISTEHINIFPNPTSGLVNIDGLNEPADIIIYNLNGQAVKSENQVLNTIDISDLPSGIYFLKLYSNHQLQLTSRIIKR